VRFPIRDAPPPIAIDASYRILFEHGALAQRELVADNQLAGMARDRRITHWIGQEAPEAIDHRGALCPVAFAIGGYSTGFAVPAIPSENLVFREEEEARPWSDYAWDAWGHPHVSPLYSPWQLLYLDVVARESSIDLPIDLALAGADELEEKLAPVRGLIETQGKLLAEIDAAWAPLIKALVSAQNVYWPRVRGGVSVIPAGPEGGWVEAGDTAEGATELLARAGCSIDELVAAYHFLVERGLDREPHDNMLMLRRAVPRAYHIRWRAKARHAQDHFDAAQILYLWLTDLTGSPPGRPESWPLDGRQAERMALYEHGPGTPVLDDALKRELIAIELYPHGPLVVGEGPCEQIIIDWLLQTLVGLRGAFRFHDLEGSGGAVRLSQLLDSFEDYPAEVFVVVDNEGDADRYVKAALNDGRIHEENVLMAEDSLEHDNFTPGELIDAAARLASSPPPDREAVRIDLSAEQLLAEHADRRERIKRHKPGIADTLLMLIQRPEHGPVRISKPEFAEALAERLAREVLDADGPERLDELKKARPIVGLVVDRIYPALVKPRPVGSNP
jgi:hypothetical protein